MKCKDCLKFNENRLKNCGRYRYRTVCADDPACKDIEKDRWLIRLRRKQEARQ